MRRRVPRSPRPEAVDGRAYSLNDISIHLATNDDPLCLVNPETGGGDQLFHPKCSLFLESNNPYISLVSPVLLGLTTDYPIRTISFGRAPRLFIDNGRFESFYRHLGNVMAEDL